jgi:hypothetical protein
MWWNHERQKTKTQQTSTTHPGVAVSVAAQFSQTLEHFDRRVGGLADCRFDDVARAGEGVQLAAIAQPIGGFDPRE